MMANRRHLRIGKLPLMSAAAIGAAALSVLPATQSFTATASAHTKQAAMVEIPVQADTAKPAGTTKPVESKPVGTTKLAETTKPAPSKVELYHQYGVQTTEWYCGPAATRMALSARGVYPSQDALANKLGTTVDGTRSAAEIARVLNEMTRTSNYQATSIPSKSVTHSQVEKLRADVVEAIGHGYPVVMNVVGSGTDVDGTTRTFAGGHYITVVGYQDNGDRVKIADSANPNSASYWMTTSELANWAGTRGYAA
jgi:Peptidase_C39 like family